MKSIGVIQLLAFGSVGLAFTTSAQTYSIDWSTIGGGGGTSGTTGQAAVGKAGDGKYALESGGEV